MLRKAVDDLGQTVVMVTHDANAAAIADRVVVLVDGRIVHDGKAETRRAGPRPDEAGRLMTAIALRNLGERKLRTRPDVAGDRPRGDDGRGHLRAHGHHQPVVRPDLHPVERGHRRGRQTHQARRDRRRRQVPPFPEIVLEQVDSVERRWRRRRRDRRPAGLDHRLRRQAARRQRRPQLRLLGPARSSFDPLTYVEGGPPTDRRRGRHRQGLRRRRGLLPSATRSRSRARRR